MEMTTKGELIDNVIQETQVVVQTVEATFLPLTNVELNQRPGRGRWSIAECFEHLNLASKIYYSELERKIGRLPDSNLEAPFSSGFWGRSLIKTMKPRSDGTIPRPMPTFPWFNPKRTRDEHKRHDGQEVLRRFLDNQKQLIQYAEQARQSDLKRTRIVSSLGPMIRFRLGDAFQFLVAHEQRHIIQAQKALAVIKKQNQ